MLKTSLTELFGLTVVRPYTVGSGNGPKGGVQLIRG